jgi:crotonobetainyl-CoA:carnitine CoA-transferase CaiB-like acyl-CoA transferase
MHPAAADLLVVETATVLAGPLVGQFFAELGATVVKIENPATGGDVTRHWKIGSEAPDESCPAYFCSVNWGKCSLALDLKTVQGRDILEDLLGRADVWIDNFRPGALERMDLSAAEIQSRFPRLVHARITAYGADDPRPGYDAALQAETGLMSMNGTAESGPLKLPLAMVDILAAHQLKQAVLLKLWEREVNGTGGEVSVSLYASGVSALANQASNYLVAGRVAERQGSGHPNIVPYGTVFPCAGGLPLVLAVGSDRQFAALVELLGEVGLAELPDFAHNRDRVRNRDCLNDLLSGLISKLDRDFLLEKLAERDIPAAPVLGIDEVMNAGATAPLLLNDMESGTAGLRTVAFEIASSTVGPEGLRRPPELNQDAREVLSSVLDYSRERIETILGRTHAGADEK